MLLDPPPPAPIDWPARPLVEQLLGIGDPLALSQGIFDVPTPFWAYLFFSNIEGALIPNTPTPEEIVPQGYQAIEPLAALKQLGGLPPLTRPAVNAGVFAPSHQTTLNLISYANSLDPEVLFGELIYKHLTGDATLAHYVPLRGTNIVQNLHLTDPRLLLDSAAGKVVLP